ncbi:hypothetical protein [Microbispora sp. GKU 823]|uniref:hypothetical protein n=1 Tax=Microbispora sp. GKU 823 TaxID=1652100 RepID=UPI0009A306D5|nr:hypothetical protein [Microbispora sp. GKU 823]OPG13642.1 hypothetical protein B1L11_06555 [Microbispora sp. GKU 823]
MRRYAEPAKVQVNQDGEPARFQAWGHTHLVVEVLGPHWETQLPWWQPEHAGKPLDRLTVRHWRVRARRARRNAVVELEQRADGWTLVGVED